MLASLRLIDIYSRDFTLVELFPCSKHVNAVCGCLPHIWTLAWWRAIMTSVQKGPCCRREVKYVIFYRLIGNCALTVRILIIIISTIWGYLGWKGAMAIMLNNPVRWQFVKITTFLPVLLFWWGDDQLKWFDKQKNITKNQNLNC